MDVQIIPEFFVDGSPGRTIFKVIGIIFVIISGLIYFFGEILFEERGIRFARVYVYGITIALLIIALTAGLVEGYEKIRNYGPETIMSPKSFWWALGGAAFFYWVRGLFPVFYGALEISVGITALLVASHTPALTIPGQLVALSAGAYVIVRGLDNIDRGLRPHHQRLWRSVWLFPLEQPPLEGALTTERKQNT